MIRSLRAIGIVAALSLNAAPSTNVSAADIPVAPTDKKLWINSEPLDLQKLSGKVVALVFYEEL